MRGLIKNPYNEDVFNKDSLLTPSWEKEHFIGCYTVFMFLCRADDTRLFIFNGIRILGQYCKKYYIKVPRKSQAKKALLPPHVDICRARLHLYLAKPAAISISSTAVINKSKSYPLKRRHP